MNDKVKVITNRRLDLTDVAFKFGDRFQAVTIREDYSKQDVARCLRTLADNIENDELIS